jgi:hypothetical protein
MRQLTLATASFEKHRKVTRRFYPKPGNGRPTVGLERIQIV